MVFPLVMPKTAAHWLQLFLYRPARNRLRRQGSLHRTKSRPAIPSVAKCSVEGRGGQSLVSGFRGTIVRSSSCFPYFMLVAFEGGSLLRALLLLLSHLLLLPLGTDGELGLRVMAFITFCGLRRKDVEVVSRAVLPKFYLEDLNSHSYRVLASVGRKVVVTRMPRVMVEGFLKGYLDVAEVVGSELQVIGGCFFTGFISSGGAAAAKSKAMKNLFSDNKADVGLVSYCNPHDHQLFVPHCKETFMVTRGETSGPSAVVPREKYPKPLVFHDGRLAFLPTPSAALFLFLYFPIGMVLAACRILIGVALPYKLARSAAPFLGFRLRVHNPPPAAAAAGGPGTGVLYVCNHRTLLDPVMLTGALGRPLTAVTYSLSPVSELLAPIRTVRLTRSRAVDAERIRELLGEGDLVVCPEGTTCREPYLLRFSALFAELAEEMEPVAVDARGSMFYGTTASGFKFLDPVFFLMNPRPEYDVSFLGRVPKECTCAGGGLSGVDVANRIQRQLGDALGFQCTTLTRKDKYLMLAGNDGVV